MLQTVIIIDFGSQYTQLIARKVRELNVYCEIHPCHHVPEITSFVKGVILSGSPFSVHQPGAPRPDLSHFAEKVPVLGICYGAQLLAYQSGGKVLPAMTREYGRARLSSIVRRCTLLKGLKKGTEVWMSHGDTIMKVPEHFTVVAGTEQVNIAAYEAKNSTGDGATIFGIQFHPEVYHTSDGIILLKNFLVDICGCTQDWTAESFIESTGVELKRKLGSDHVALALSGGVDSTVTAMLLHKVAGNRLHCIFVDNGLLRKNEYADVLKRYEHMKLNIHGVDARERFYRELTGSADPEQKRKIIGRVFIEVFEEEARRLSNIRWLGQGTIYPDVIESVSVKGPSATIKSHHNVGGLPGRMKLKVVEPLRLLFKDEVRRVGQALGIDKTILRRHPFPGPGLAVRILGEITPQKVQLLQEVDFLFIEGLKKAGLYDKIWQAGAILLPVQSVGVMGDERTYENAVCLRAVTSTDGMTADWYPLPYDFLGKISNDIINKVKGVNRVVYDVSSKPPATIEWE